MDLTDKVIKEIDTWKTLINWGYNGKVDHVLAFMTAQLLTATAMNNIVLSNKLTYDIKLIKTYVKGDTDESRLPKV